MPMALRLSKHPSIVPIEGICFLGSIATKAADYEGIFENKQRLWFSGVTEGDPPSGAGGELEDSGGSVAGGILNMPRCLAGCLTNRVRMPAEGHTTQ